MARRRRLKRLSEFLFKVHPAWGLRVAERRGLHIYERSLRRRPRDIPTPEEWKAAFGKSDADDWKSFAREYALSHYRLHLIQNVAAEGGLDRVVPLVRWKGRKQLEELKRNHRPAILTTWHAGPTIGIWAGLADLGVSLIRVQETRWQVEPPGWKILFKQGVATGAPIIKQCLKQLRSGGWVAIPFDAFTEQPGHRRVRLLGHSAPVPRGIVALAEMSGAPVIPLAARWTSGGRAVEVEVQEPIDTRKRPGEVDVEFEARFLEEAMSRLEAYLNERPHELNLFRLRYLLRQPLWEPGGDGKADAG